MRRLPVRLAGPALFALVGMTVVSAPGPVRAATHTVDIADFAFAPAELTITVGDTVTWTNRDAIEHTATSTSGAFDSGLLAQDESYSVTFTAPGTYDYLCTPHPMMTGRIVVVAAAQPSAAPTASVGVPGGGGALPDVAMPAPRTTSSATLIAGVLLASAGVTGVALFSRRQRRRQAR